MEFVCTTVRIILVGIRDIPKFWQFWQLWRLLIGKEMYFSSNDGVQEESSD